MSEVDMHRQILDEKENRINELNVEIQKQHMMMMDDARDASILYAMLSHFVVRAVERGDYDAVKQALEYAYNDTGLDWDIIAEAVERMGVCDPEFCQREFLVTVTVPVSVSVVVHATSDENAEDEARNEIDSNGLDNYYMEFDLWNNADFYVEES